MSDNVLDLEWFRNLLRSERRTEAGYDVLQRRNLRARLEGWKSYRQKRYWLQERPGGNFTTDLKGTARQLAGHLSHGGRNCPGRGGSLFCTACDVIVNGDGERYARGVGGFAFDGTRPGDPDLERRGDWRARLVQAYLAAR